MLEELVVRNLGLIQEARLEPGAGLVVVTGETGAGKTLLLGALRLLCGSQARQEQVGPWADEASVEGRFAIDGDELVAARRLVSGGRNRAYLDGAMVPARALEERLRPLVEVVGQHDHVALARRAEVRSLIDASLPADDRRRLPDYRALWQRLEELRDVQARLGGDGRVLQRELDLVGFQAEEIERAALRSGEDEELQARLGRLRHAEELAEGLARVLESTEAGREAVGASVAELRRARALDPGLATLADQAEEAAALLAELAADSRRAAESLEHRPEELTALEARVAVIGDLRRKYGETLEEVLDFGRAAAGRRDELRRLLERSEGLEEEIGRAARAVESAGAQLTEARRGAAAHLTEEAVSHLRQLGFRDPVLEVTVEPADPGPWGADEAGLLFASDAALRPAPVSRVASGGELSRLVLSLRLAAGAGSAAVVAFDEIDAGLGGETALALGRKLAALGRGRQVLCVTHLPQVAAFADHHLVVERSDNRAVVGRVEDEARVEELSRMLAGLPDSERGRGHAEELLALRG